MAGIITGESVLVDRYPYEDADKVLPVTAEIIKEHIQAYDNYDDQLILGVSGYLTAARDEVEDRGSVSLIHQTRKHFIGQSDLEAGLDGVTVAIPRGPIVEVTAIKYLDASGDEQTLSAPLYRVNTSLAAVYFIGPVPTLADGPDTLWIEYESGYGIAATSIPAKWANLVMTLAMRKYDFRGGDSGATNSSWERLIRQMFTNAGDSSHRYA